MIWSTPFMIHVFLWLNKTGGPWTTSFTWETSSNQQNIFAQSYDFIIMFIRRGKNLSSPFDSWKVLICKTLSLLHPWMLYAKFGWNWPSGSEEEVENVNSLQMDRQTDRQKNRQTDRQQAIRKFHLSFQLRWAKKCHGCTCIK